MEVTGGRRKEEGGTRQEERRPADAGYRSVREEEEQVEPGALDASELHALRAGRLRDVGLHAQVFLELIFENQLRRLRIAEALPDAEEQMLSDLLAHAQRRTEAALPGLDLEFVELERVADRPRQAGGEVAAAPAPWRARSTTPADPSPSSLIGWLNTMSDRMSAWSSGGLLVNDSSGCFIVPCTRTNVSTPEMMRRARMLIVGFSSSLPSNRMWPSRRISKRRPWNE